MFIQLWKSDDNALYKWQAISAEVLLLPWWHHMYDESSWVWCKLYEMIPEITLLSCLNSHSQYQHSDASTLRFRSITKYLEPTSATYLGAVGSCPITASRIPQGVGARVLVATASSSHGGGRAMWWIGYEFGEKPTRLMFQLSDPTGGYLMLTN